VPGCFSSPFVQRSSWEAPQQSAQDGLEEFSVSFLYEQDRPGEAPRQSLKFTNDQAPYTIFYTQNYPRVLSVADVAPFAMSVVGAWYPNRSRGQTT